MTKRVHSRGPATVQHQPSDTAGIRTTTISAEGRIYFLNDQGVMNVVTAGPEFIRVARNAIGEKCFASPAISQGQLFLRGEHHLFCITAGNPRP
ncbi:MAG: hypothetical protein WCT12_26505 [Verrucomicrobiota bacterium]